MKLMMARENDDEGVKDDRGGECQQVGFYFFVTVREVIFERGRMIFKFQSDFRERKNDPKRGRGRKNGTTRDCSREREEE